MRCGILSIKKTKKIWRWRAVDCVRNKTVGWTLGYRDAKTFKRLYEKLKDVVKVFYTDDWEVYRRVIPAENLVQGKKHTIGIEQNNSNVRHSLGRMTRRTKVVSHSKEMIDLSLRISYGLNERDFYAKFQKQILAIF